MGACEDGMRYGYRVTEQVRGAIAEATEYGP